MSFEERAGPILVKEVRQGLKGKVFALLFGFVLLACLVAASVAVGTEYESRGEHLAVVYLILLSGVCCFVMPLVLFRSMIREREDETWVLLALTGLGGARIVRGKFVSALVQLGLYLSAVAPFLVFTYYLNGISLVQVLLAVALPVGLGIILMASALALAAHATHRLTRTASLFAAIGVCGLACVAVVSLGGRLVGREPTVDAELGVLAAGLTAAAVALIDLALESAAACLSLPSDNVAAGLRAAWLRCGLVAWAWGLAQSAAEDRLTANDCLGGAVLTCFFLALTGVVAISEPDGWRRRFESKQWEKPGALRSFMLAGGLLTGTGVVWLAVMAFFSEPREKAVLAVVACAAYPLLYLSLGVMAGRLSPLRHLRDPLATRLGWVASVLAGVLSGLLLSVLFTGRAFDRSLQILSPVFGMVNFLDRSGGFGRLMFLLAVTAVSLIAALTVLRTRDVEHQ